jgi:hypothetical protein
MKGARHVRCYFCKTEVATAVSRFVPAQNRREKSCFRNVCDTCSRAIDAADGKHYIKSATGITRIEKAPGRFGLVGSIVTSSWPLKVKAQFQTVDGDRYSCLVGIDHNGEGHFVMWDGDFQALDMDSYGRVLADAKRAGLKAPFHVYARYEIFQSPNVRFVKCAGQTAIGL